MCMCIAHFWDNAHAHWWSTIILNLNILNSLIWIINNYFLYGNVKSFDLFMGDLYWADQGEEETIPSFATRIEGLLSQIRDRFLDQLPLQEEQRLLKDCLFHGSRKSIRDSVKYCFADADLDYMHFLEECRKSEEEGKAGQAKAAPKAKMAAATVPPPSRMSSPNSSGISNNS